MNIYAKFWKPVDCEPEMLTIYGVRFGKHAEAKDRHYKARSMDLISPLGMLSITFTNNHDGYYDHWKRYWKEEVDWQLFKGKRK